MPNSCGLYFWISSSLSLILSFVFPNPAKSGFPDKQMPSSKGGRSTLTEHPDLLSAKSLFDCIFSYIICAFYFRDLTCLRFSGEKSHAWLPGLDTRTTQSLFCVCVKATGSEAQKVLEQGNKHFARKEHLKALEAYDKALKASDSQAERPLLYSNKAACYMMLQRQGFTFLNWFLL